MQSTQRTIDLDLNPRYESEKSCFYCNNKLGAKKTNSSKSLNSEMDDFIVICDSCYHSWNDSTDLRSSFNSKNSRNLDDKFSYYLLKGKLSRHNSTGSIIDMINFDDRTRPFSFTRDFFPRKSTRRSFLRNNRIIAVPNGFYEHHIYDFYY